MVDPTLEIDGSKCKICKGTIVADPVEEGAPARAKCRNCGTNYEGKANA